MRLARPAFSWPALAWPAWAIVESRERLAWRVLAAAACICAAVVTADSLYLTVHFFQPLFIADPWETVKDFQAVRAGTYRLADLFAQHNEHRLAVPRLIFFVDFDVGRGLNVVNIAAIYLFQAFHAAVLVAMASRLSRGSLLAIQAAAVVILLFSFGQSDNLTFGFQVQFVGVYAAATLAFLAAALAPQPGVTRAVSIGAMAGAVVAATVATYMMSNGMFAALVMVGLAVAIRARLALLATTLVFAAAILFAYLHGAQFGGGSPLVATLPQRALAVAAYGLVYVGGVAGAFGLGAAGSLGLCGIVLSVVAALRLVRGENAGAVHAALVGVMAFILGTAAVTAWGRVGFGLPQALESRYMTPSAVFWSAQVVYWGSFARFAAGRRLPQALLIVLAGTTGVCAVARHLQQRPSAQWNFMDANLGTDALLSGVFAPQAVQQLYPDPAKLEHLAAFLAREKLNVFAWPEADWRGRRLADVVPMIDDGRCSVVLDKRTRLDPKGDVAVEGWAWDKLRRKPVARIVLAGPDGTIVGFGSGGWFRPDFRTLPKVEHAEPGWKGYATASDAGTIRPYAILDHGRIACGGH